MRGVTNDICILCSVFQVIRSDYLDAIEPLCTVMSYLLMYITRQNMLQYTGGRPGEDNLSSVFLLRSLQQTGWILGLYIYNDKKDGDGDGDGDGDTEI